jgi:NAD-dependent deacetylase
VFGVDRVRRTLEVSTVFIAIGTSGLVEPAASFVGQTRARTFYVGPEEPLNLASFDETFEGKAGKLLPTLFDVGAG